MKTENKFLLFMLHVFRVPTDFHFGWEELWFLRIFIFKLNIKVQRLAFLYSRKNLFFFFFVR